MVVSRLLALALGGARAGLTLHGCPNLALALSGSAPIGVENGAVSVTVNSCTGDEKALSFAGSAFGCNSTIQAASVLGTAADGSRLIDLQQNTDTNEPGAPAAGYSRIYCEEDHHAAGIDACFLHHAGLTGDGHRILTDDAAEGILIEKTTAPGTPPGTTFVSLYAKTGTDKLYLHAPGGSEEEVCSGTCGGGGVFNVFAASSLGSATNYYQNWRAIEGDGGHVGTNATANQTVVPRNLTVSAIYCALSAGFGGSRNVYVENNGTNSTGCTILFSGSTTTGSATTGCSEDIDAGQTVQLTWDEPSAASGADVSCVLEVSWR